MEQEEASVISTPNMGHEITTQTPRVMCSSTEPASVKRLILWNRLEIQYNSKINNLPLVS